METSERISTLFSLQQEYKLTQRLTTAQERIALLQKLKSGLKAAEPKFITAFQKDMEKPPFETFIVEIMGIMGSIDYACANLEKWMQPEVKPAMINPKAKAIIQPEARGNVLIIGPWNFPLILLILPLVDAIAAGNCAILKPSELTPEVSKVIAEFISEIFPPEIVTVVEGSVSETTELLKLPFDHIFFTGSPNVGKIVMAAAAKNLTSVTLELGGKSPAIIDKEVDLEKAVATLINKKLLNAGQLCVTPDYLLLTKEQEPEFLKLAEAKIKELYYPNGEYNKVDSSRIINEKNFLRIKGLVDEAVADGAKIAVGGVFHQEEWRIEPTILTNVSKTSKIMDEEIFGPILPIINYEELDEIVQLINSKSKPLALYIFSNVKENIEYILNRTSAGGVTVNEAIMQLLDLNLPFGGVNGSGMGSYMGEYGFKEFSHLKPIWVNEEGADIDTAIYPPYAGKLAQFKEIMGW